MNKHGSKKKTNNDETSPIDHRRINALSRAFDNLPQNGFSKLVVFTCLVGIFAVIITSFIFLAQGKDASAIQNGALAALTGELFILGARSIFNRQANIEQVLMDEITKELNDGVEYPVNGDRGNGYKINATSGSSVNMNENITKNMTETVNGFGSGLNASIPAGSSSGVVNRGTVENGSEAITEQNKEGSDMGSMNDEKKVQTEEVEIEVEESMNTLEQNGLD